MEKQTNAEKEDIYTQAKKRKYKHDVLWGHTKAERTRVYILPAAHKKWIVSKQKFINYTSCTYGGNEETSLELKRITMITMEKPIIPMAKELEEKVDLEQDFIREKYCHDQEAFKDILQRTKNNLTRLCKTLWDNFNPIMQNKIKAQEEYSKIL